ncbi:MAG TPA: TonB-dependent receptor, partial [Polyangiaceae bacterium]
ALSETVRASLGARLDAYSTFGTSINPRAALIWHPYTDGNSKVIAGKAFRAPSIYELYYNDGGTTQIASPDLHPESIYSLELEHSHRFSRTVTGVLALFSNYVTDLVELREAPSDPTLIQYQNSPTPLVTTGAELGIRRDWRQGWMLGASYGFTHAQFLASGGASDLFVLKSNPAKRHAANAPQHSASVKGAVPLLARALTAATRLTLEDVRYDRFEDEDPTAEPQRRTDAAVVWDIVLSGEEKRFGLSYAFGVYNAFDWRYSLPVSPEFRQRTIEQDGRTFLASLGLAL